MNIERNEEEFQDESDSDDADFVPEGPESDVSEEEDEEKTVNGETSATKRKRGGKSKTKRKKRKKGDESEDTSDDEEYTGDANGSRTEEGSKPEEVDEEEEKRRTDKLYSEFLLGVEDISKRRKSGGEQEAAATSVTKVYDFAGEKVVVEERVSQKSVNGTSKSEDSNSSSSSSNNVPAGTDAEKVRETSASSAPKSSNIPFKSRVSILSGSPAQIGLGNKPGAKKGLSAVLSAIQSKKQKIGTLDKTRLDWQKFKKAEGIEEELQVHTKSKNGYLARQEFLQRTDLRQFEIEKSLRARQRRNP